MYSFLFLCYLRFAIPNSEFKISAKDFSRLTLNYKASLNTKRPIFTIVDAYLKETEDKRSKTIGS